MSANTKTKVPRYRGGTAQIRIGGEAGQGVILAGVMLAETAAEDGLEVAQSARYGAAVRGGVATADIVVSDEEIDFPHVEEPDFLVVLSQETYDSLATVQKEGTLVIYDPFFVKPKDLPGITQVAVPATDGALKEFGKATGANLISLSALSALTGVISEASLLAVVEQGPAKKFLASNLKALALGKKMAATAEEELG